ncbi:MAG: DKNYY domain-containing protein [Muribaculaceae bacterium]|nr:DKNYY domain-containing protein [Muribaculaceae bacterium]
MNRNIFSLSLVALLLLCVSCNTDGKYIVHNGTVCYSYWTFSFGTRYDSLPGVDITTFHSVKGWIGHDAERVYFKDKLVPGVDISTLEIEKYPLFRDKNDYYYENVPMHVADRASFKVLRWNEEDFWAQDNRYAYYDTICIKDVDLPTFKVKAWNTAVDKNHVYRYGEILPLADPATYDEVWKGLYSRDKSHIWYCGSLLEDVDYATFDVDKEGHAFDKNGRFHGEKRVTDEDE